MFFGGFAARALPERRSGDGMAPDRSLSVLGCCVGCWFGVFWIGWMLVGCVARRLLTTLLAPFPCPHVPSCILWRCVWTDTSTTLCFWRGWSCWPCVADASAAICAGPRVVCWICLVCLWIGACALVLRPWPFALCPTGTCYVSPPIVRLHCTIQSHRFPLTMM